MKLSFRLIRRLIIVVVFLTVFFLLGYGTRQLTQAQPKCDDGIKNGQEEGVDCGLFACGNYCEPDLASPSVISTELIEVKDGDYDFVAEVRNPHMNFGASEVSYEMTLFGVDDGELLKKNGVFYILPSQDKFLILPALAPGDRIGRVDFKIVSAKWRRLDSLEGMSFVIKRHALNNNSNAPTSLSGIILNDSDTDFNLVDVDIVLYNSQGKIVGVNKTDIRTLVARTERGFFVSWPSPIRDKVTKTEIRVSTNLFTELNFIKRYGSSPEKFQEYK